MSIHRPTMFLDDPRESAVASPDGSILQEIGDNLPDPVNAVQRTVRSLLKISMNAAEGDYIGSEGDLQSRLNISRPTFRQAAKIVQNDCFIEIRRGVNGGIFAARPEMQDVVQRPALFLRLAGADISDAQRVNRLIAPYINATAARDATPQLRQNFLDLANQCDMLVDRDIEARDVLATERSFGELVTAATGNPFFGLIIGITNEFGLWEHNLRIYQNQPERCRQWIGLIATHCRAIATGDADLAVDLSAKRSQLVSEWIGNHGQDSDPDNASA